jgi:hypothetical protein
VTPLAPDPRFLGAIDPEGVTTDLDEVHGARLQAGQAAGGLVANIVHHLRWEEGKIRGGGVARSVGVART